MTGIRRSLLLAVMAVLLLVDGGLLGVLASRRWKGSESVIHPATRIDWTQLTNTDLRIAGIFGALQREGLGPALDLLEHTAREDSVVLRDGHQLAHALGRLAVASRGGDAGVIRECSPTMASGCYHGVVEAFVQARGRVDMAELQRMCATAGSADRPGTVYECMHGLGHSVLGAVGTVDEALHDCDALSPGFESWCYAGVFMEGMRPTSSTHHEHSGHSAHAMLPLPIDASDPFSPCDRFSQPYASACWIFQGFVILEGRGFDSAEAFRTCDRAPAAWIADCYRSVGFQLTGLFQRDDGWILEQCGHGRSSWAEVCAAGAARALAEADWSGTRPERFCRAAPRDWKGACYRATGNLLATFASVAQRRSLCARVEAEYVDLCRRTTALQAPDSAVTRSGASAGERE